MIICVGHTSIDYISEVPRFPGRNSSIFIREYNRLFGGGAANVSYILAKLGCRPSLLSPIGKDFSDVGYKDHLEDVGVNLEYTVEMDEKTSRAFIYTDEKDDQITFFYWGASDYFSMMDIPEDLNNCSIVHLAPSDPEYNMQVSEVADYSSFDPGQDLPVYSSNQLDSIISNVDILFCNEYEIERIKEKTGRKLEEIRNMVDILVITRGKKGSNVYARGTVYNIPVVDVDAEDPTGAGDGYRAGFLTALEKGYSIEECGKIASTVASFIVEEVGCQTNAPRWSDMVERFEDFFGGKIE